MLLVNSIPRMEINGKNGNVKVILVENNLICFVCESVLNYDT